MTLKPGVRIIGVKPEIVVAMMVADGVYRSLGYELTITSAVEGKHSRGSIHYQGMAFDCRITNLSPAAPAIVREAIQKALGGDFDVVLESDHIHIEYEPKEAL
jgi:hypothetical protein